MNAVPSNFQRMTFSLRSDWNSTLFTWTRLKRPRVSQSPPLDTGCQCIIYAPPTAMLVQDSLVRSKHVRLSHSHSGSFSFVKETLADARRLVLADNSTFVFLGPLLSYSTRLTFIWSLWWRSTSITKIKALKDPLSSSPLACSRSRS